ncbi:MAG: hypothetical protein R2751_19505 [Bacteroidales bacterium]
MHVRGDSPSYLYLVDWGLRSTEDPSYGGIRGRFKASEGDDRYWIDGQDVTGLNPETGRRILYPQVRWFEVIQNDFAARADWCVMSPDEANHAPVVRLESDADLQATPARNQTQCPGLRPRWG